MKGYQKPQCTLNQLNLRAEISSLNDWLDGAGSDFAQAGITTYILAS